MDEEKYKSKEESMKAGGTKKNGTERGGGNMKEEGSMKDEH